MSRTQTNEHDAPIQVIAESAAEPAPEDPIALLRRRLRGRMPLVAALALLIGVGGATLGYTASPLLYESHGQIRVTHRRPTILYESDENVLPGSVQSYIAAQRVFLTSRDLLEIATASPDLQAAGWPAGEDGVRALQRALSVDHRRNEEFLTVSITHRNPQLAKAAVDALLVSFAEHYHDPNTLPTDVKAELLHGRRTALQDDLQSIREQMLDASDHYGAETVIRLYDSKVRELIDLDERITEIDLLISLVESGSDLTNVSSELADLLPGHGTAAPPRDPLADLRLKQNELLAERRTWEHKYGPRHPVVRDLNQQLESLQLQMDLRLETLGLSGGAGSVAVATGSVVDRLNDLRSRLIAMRDMVREDASVFGQQRVAIIGLQEEEEELRQRLADTRRRLDEIQVESSTLKNEHVNIAAWGDVPVAPISDRRRALAMAGLLAGMALGVGIVFIIGTFDPTCRYLDELEAIETMPPVIAVLPDLNTGHQESVELSSLGIHQLRNILEVRNPDRTARVYTVTSAARGEGKTSLTMALGSSLAIAGRRTLIIDADIRRHDLTDSLELTGKPGLQEALEGGQSGGEIHATEQANLWVLPVGDHRLINAEDLSRERLQWLLNAIVSRFDIVLIDTSPILEGLEATVATAIADRTLLTIARRQHRADIRAAIDRLDRVGATCAGVVYNKAGMTDVKHHDLTPPGQSRRIVSLLTGLPRSAAETAPIGRIGYVGPGASTGGTRRRRAA